VLRRTWVPLSTLSNAHCTWQFIETTEKLDILVWTLLSTCRFPKELLGSSWGGASPRGGANANPVAKNVADAFKLTAKAVKAVNPRAKVYVFKSKGGTVDMGDTYELAAFVTPAPQPGALRAVLNKILGKRIEIVALPPQVR
jgi:hypothetical protein